MPDHILYEKLAHYCAYQDRCVYDVRLKLKQMNVAPEEVAPYVERLQHEKFLDEERFVRAFVAGHLRKRWGKARIKMALLGKKIDPALIEQHLSAIDPAHYEEQAMKAARTKLKTGKGLTALEQKMKLTRFLLQKGFESALVQKVVRQLLE